MSSVKIQKLNGTIQRELSMIFLNEVRDRKLKFVTVTAVETTNDLSFAKVFVTFMGSEGEKKRGMEALEKSSGYIRSLLAKKLKVRKVPELIFKIDESVEYGNKIEKIISELHHEEHND